jgi:hypothetical protein
MKIPLWWPMEGAGEGSNVWWLVEGAREGSNAWWPMEGKGEGSFSPFSTFPPKRFYLDLCVFPLKLKFYFTMVIGRYLRISSFFLGL